MKLQVELMPNEAAALDKFAADFGPFPVEEAASFALREFLITTGYLKLAELDEDTPTVGEA